MAISVYLDTVTAVSFGDHFKKTFQDEPQVKFYNPAMQVLESRLHEPDAVLKISGKIRAAGDDSHEFLEEPVRAKPNVIRSFCHQVFRPRWLLPALGYCLLA